MPGGRPRPGSSSERGPRDEPARRRSRASAARADPVTLIHDVSHEALVTRLLEARERLRGVAHRTPVVTSRTLDRVTGARLHFKCENLQRMGAFKFRGAYHAISRLDPEARRRGVIAYSSGNHAQAVALVAKLLDAPAEIG